MIFLSHESYNFDFSTCGVRATLYFKNRQQFYNDIDFFKWPFFAMKFKFRFNIFFAQISVHKLVPQIIKSSTKKMNVFLMSYVPQNINIVISFWSNHREQDLYFLRHHTLHIGILKFELHTSFWHLLFCKHDSSSKQYFHTKKKWIPIRW